MSGRSIITYMALALVCATPSFGEDLAWGTDVKAVIAAAEPKQRDVLVFVSTEHCPPCDMMEAATFADPKVQEILRSFALVKTKDAAAVKEIAFEPVIGFPTCLLVRGGKCRAQLLGGYDKTQFPAVMETTSRLIREIDDLTVEIDRSPNAWKQLLARADARRGVGDAAGARSDAKRVKSGTGVPELESARAEVILIEIELFKDGIDAEDEDAWNIIDKRLTDALERLRGTGSEARLRISWARGLMLMNKRAGARSHLEAVLKLGTATDEERKLAKALLESLDSK